jgi:hypothetical protein
MSTNGQTIIQPSATRKKSCILGIQTSKDPEPSQPSLYWDEDAIFTA